MSKNRLYFRIRPFRLLGYLFWLGCMFVMYLMFRSFLLLFFTLFLVAFPFISIVTAFFPARKLGIIIRVSKAYSIKKGDELIPTIEIHNPLYIGSSDVVINIGVRNIFLSEEESDLTVSLPVVARKLWRRTERYGKSGLMIPFVAERIGDYSFSLKDAQVSDLLGVVRIGIRCDEQTVDAPVLPKRGKGQMPDSESISSGMTEVEESTRMGNDFSEVTDIREYRPGDRIRDIHWKLSARQGSLPVDSLQSGGKSDAEWMVKIRTQMAGMELSVVMALDADAKTAERIIERTYGELTVWSSGETDIRLLVYNASSYGFDEYILCSPADVDAAFEDILGIGYRMHLPSDTSFAALDGIIKNLYPYMGGYILFGTMEDGSIGWTVVEGLRV